MIDIKLIRENSELVKENIRKKFQDDKLGLVDEVFLFDETYFHQNNTDYLLLIFQK